MILSNDATALAALFLDIHSHDGIALLTIQPLTVLSFFSIISISVSIAFFFSLVLRSFTFPGVKHISVCS